MSYNYQVGDNMENILEKSKFLYIDSSRFDADWHSTLHSHSFTELFYVVKGKGQFQFGDTVYKDVQEDSLVIINPNIVHTEISDKNDPLEYIVLGIDGIEFSLDIDDDYGYSIHNYNDYKHEVLFYLKAILEEEKNKDRNYFLMIDQLLNVLVMNVLRRTVSELNITKGNTDENKDCIFIENYLNIHFREEITLDKLAELTFMNKYYLSHIFKEHSGQSPIEYLLEKRISEAKKLLKTTDLSISQIANIVGFNSASYFSQYFKKINNLSPSQYRKKNK